MIMVKQYDNGDNGQIKRLRLIFSTEFPNFRDYDCTWFKPTLTQIMLDFAQRAIHLRIDSCNSCLIVFIVIKV